MNAEQNLTENLRCTSSLARGVYLARKHMPAIVDDSQDCREAILATAIMLSTFCASSGTGEEAMMELLKSVHAITREFDGEQT